MATRNKRTANPKGEPSGEGGKEQRFTREQVEAALRDSGGLVTSAAAKLKCTRSTVYDYLERFPDLKLIRKDADEMVSDLAEANIMLAVKSNNISVSQWWLNQKARHRGFGDRLDVEGDIGGGAMIAGAKRVVIKIIQSKHAQGGGEPS